MNNPIFLKIGGGVAAAGSVGGIGYYGYTQKWFSADDSIYLITQVGEVTDQSTANLYNGNDKNYSCKYGEVGKEEKMDCDILKDLTLPTTGSKKWIDFSSVDGKEQDKTIVYGKMKKDSFFSIKIEPKFYDQIKKILEDSTTNTKKIIIEPIKPAAAGETKKFGEFKIVAGKQNGKAIGKFQKFLGKAGATNSAVAATGSKCSFGEKFKDKACSIDIFADTQGTMTAEKNYNELTYKGSESAVASSTQLVENNYYVVKFTGTDDKFTHSDIENNDLVFIDATNSNSVKKVTFKKHHPVIVHPEASSTNKILIIF